MGKFGKGYVQWYHEKGQIRKLSEETGRATGLLRLPPTRGQAAHSSTPDAPSTSTTM